MRSHDSENGRLFIIGTGPGNLSSLTGRGREALAASEYVVGNKIYLDFIAPLIEGKEVIKSSMGKEVERARQACELAKDHAVSIVSGGDPGVYGMASIVLEIIDHESAEIDVEIVPGVTAATAAASKLGSPLSGDYVTISLSDLLTPWEVISHRLTCAFRMGVPVAVYNPRSRGRPHNFGRAMEIAARHLKPDAPVGIVKNAYRTGEAILITTLGEIKDHEDFVDMHSIVIVGGEESRIWRAGNEVRGIITPRGYHRKYVY